MLERWGAVEGCLDPLQLESVGCLPADLVDSGVCAAKLERDQKKLLAIMQYARADGDHQNMLADYFAQ